MNRAGLEALGLRDPDPEAPLKTDESTSAPGHSHSDVDAAFSAFAPRRTAADCARTAAGTPSAPSAVSSSASAAWSTPHATWGRCPVRSETDGLAGLTDGGEIRRFAPSDVRTHPLVRRGETIGMSFLADQELRYDRTWAKGYVPADEVTHYYAPGVRPTFDRGWGHDVRRTPAPWPDKPFFISTHGHPDSVAVRLTDGTRLRVLGDTLARLVATSEPFRSAVGRDDPRAIALLVCYAGTDARPGGVGFDFQHTLESEFGHRQPVVGATHVVDLWQDPSTPRETRSSGGCAGCSPATCRGRGCRPAPG
ncbi:hypothetical protein [Kutzneria kofuensis]|uniref:hypothetical protein n=1 Tax=Kutzneria kofuensis TaxID=103725 RepID=UPI0031EA3D31